MAASDESCDGNPDFAVICSFITKFGNDCGVNITIPDLQQMLEDTKNAIHEDLAELHIHLLRRGRKRVTKEKWEKSLIKFCHEYSSVDAWELERFGYKKAKLSVKLELLKRLLELQFDSNAKFKSEVNKHEANTLRIPPVGRDIDGQVYWYQLDREYNMRLYRQGPEEDSTWKLLCSNTEHLRNLLANLQKNITKDPLSEDKVSEGDESSTLKMETDGDDMTSRMSETKPNTIIIKTEKKEPTPSTTAENAVKSPVKKDDDITLIEKENNLAIKAPPTNQEIKSEVGSDTMDVTEVIVKKEVPLISEDCVTPMEVDDCTPEKAADEKVPNAAPKSDVEMSDAEQVTDIKKTHLPPTEKGLDKSFQDDSTTIEKQSAYTDNLSNSKHPSMEIIPAAEQSVSKDTDLAVESSMDMASPSVTIHSSSMDVKENPILPSDVTSTAVEQIEAKYKGGKIKLYEKWSKEKKQAADAKQNLKAVASSHQKSEKVAKQSPQGILSKSKSSVPPSSASQSEEAPMDLSVSFRSDDSAGKVTIEHVASDITAVKQALIPDKGRTSRNHVGVGEKHQLQPTPENKCSSNSSEAPRPFKKKHSSMAVDETSDLGRKSVIFEVKSNKLLNQFQESSGDATVKEKVPASSGFSHLQALQNMCNENPMTCFQSSVIRSASPDKRLKTDSGLSKYGLNSLEKSSYNEANCDNISQKYKFSSSQLSGDVQHISETDVPPLLLKSNVHSSSDIASVETTSPQQMSSGIFKSSTSEVQSCANNSSKTIFPSEREHFEKQLKDTDCSGSLRLLTSDTHSSQKLKVDSEKIPIFKKHSRTNNHSVASIMERDYKEVAKPNLNESSNICDKRERIGSDSKKDSLQTSDKEEFLSTDKNSLHSLDKKSENVLLETCSKQDILPTNAAKVAESSDSETIKTNLNISNVASVQKSYDKTTSKIESSISNDTELKSTKTVGTEEADTSCSSNKSNSFETQSLKVTDLKLLSGETNKTCSTSENEVNCDKSEKHKLCSTTTEKKQSEVNISKDSKSITGKVVDSSNLVKENAVIDCPKIALSLSPKSNKESTNSIDLSNDSEKESKDSLIVVESRTNSSDVTALIDIKNNETCEQKSEASLDIEPIKTDSESCTVEKKTAESVPENLTKGNGCSQTVGINKELSLVIESPVTSEEPSKTIKDSEKKISDKHSIASIIDKKDSVNKLTTSSEVSLKNNVKDISVSLPTESLPIKTENTDSKLEVCSKIESTKDESEKNKQDDLVLGSISVEKDCSPIEKAKVDFEDGKPKENISNDKEKHPDSTITDSNLCTSDELCNLPVDETNSKSEEVCDNVSTSPEELCVSKTIKVSEQVIELKENIQDIKDNEKESILGKEKSIEIVKDMLSKTDSKSIDLGETSSENEFKATEVPTESTKASSKKVAEVKDSVSSSFKDSEKHLEVNKTSSDMNTSLVTQSPVEEKKKSQILIDDAKNKESINADDAKNKESINADDAKNKESINADDAKNKEFIDVKEAVSEENSNLVSKCSLEGKVKTEVSKEQDAKLEDSSEVISENRIDTNKTETAANTPKDSKIKVMSRSKQTPPESSKKLKKTDKAKQSKNPANDKKSKDIKNSLSNNATIEDNCLDSSNGKKKKEPISEKLPKTEKLEVIAIDSSKKKCDVSLKTKLKINIKDPLGIYFVMHNSCLESKMRHPSVEKLKKIPPSSLASKPKLITTFSMDTIDDVHVIQSVIDSSPTKKKRGRLRQNTTNPPSPKTTPLKTKSKATPKSAAISKKAAAVTEEKSGFNIPEGFLEILSNTQSDGTSAKKEAQKKSRGRRLEISTPSLENSESESAPIKRSRRIQDLQQKKMSELAVEMEREQRIIEQMAKKSVTKSTPQKSPIKAKEAKPPKVSKLKFQPPAPEESASNTCMESKRTPRKMNSRSRNMTKMHLLYEDESKDSEFSTSRETEKSKKRRRGRGANGKKGYKPWDLSSESESTLEEITDEEEEEEHEEVLVFTVNEDEFACEEIEEDAEPIVVRRARTAKKIIEDAAVEETVVTDDKPCSKCGKYDKPEWILLCDKCDSGYHTTCLIPPLMIIPEGDWYCHPCEHIFLCEWIQKELHKLEVVLKQREREELRKQRLAYVGISLDNVLKPEKKEKSDDSSKESDNDEDESEEEEDSRDVKSRRDRRRDRDSSSEEERTKKLYGKRSVRARRTVNYQFKEYDELIASAIGDEVVDVKVPEETAESKVVDDDEENDSDKAFQAKFPKQKKRKTTRLNDLDISDDEDSGEEYKGSSASDSEQSVAPSVSGSDGGSAASGEWRIVRSKGKSKRKTKRGRRNNSDEDWDEENDSDGYRPVTRRAAQKAVVSYREISSDDEWDPKPKAVKKRKKVTSSEDSEASYKRKKPKIAAKTKAKKKRVRKWASSDSSEESERSINYSESSESKDKWKVKKTSESSRLKININKKVLSSDENEEESQESAPKKQSNKIVSDKEEEEEDESEEEEGDEDEEEEGSSEEEDDDEEEEEKKPEVKAAKPEAKALKPEIKDPNVDAKLSFQDKVPVKPESTKVAEPQVALKKDSLPSTVPVEPIREKIVASAVQDKPVRTVKKDATKMVPCVIPYDKSPPKSGHGTTPDDESDKEKEKIQNAPKPVPYSKSIPQQYLPKSVPKPPSGVITSTAAPPKPSNKAVPASDRRPFASSIVQPFSNLDEDVDSDDEVPLERIPTVAPNPLPNKPLAYEREPKYTPAKELPGFTYTAPEEKCFPPTYSTLAPFQDYSSRPSPLKPSLVETYNRSSPSKLTPLDSYTQVGSVKGPYPLKPSLVETYNRSSPSKLTPLDSYSQSSSPKGFISLDSYSEARKKKQHFYGNPGPEHDVGPRPPMDTYQREIGFPPEPTPFPPSPSTYHRATPPHVQRDPGTPPRFHSQYPDSYGPPRSPEYYQNSQYYHGEERVPRPAYQPNYVPPEHGGPPYVPNPYVATPVPQPNGGFMIDRLLRARNPEEGEDELTGVTDIVSYITQE